MTSPKYLYSRAKHVNAIWAPRCTKYVFVTTNITNLTDLNMPIVELHVPDGRNFLWAKTKAAHQYIYDNELDNFDWFLKADDDTYVIMENLRFMFLAYSPSNPVYFGCKFKPFAKQGYMSGGSGYVLSREAVKTFVEKGLSNHRYCRKLHNSAEDVQIGKCLEKVNVTAGDSRDAKDCHRMSSLLLTSQMKLGNGTSLPKWFYQYICYPYRDRKECCFDYAVSFHYVNGELMHTSDNLFYHIKPIGSIDNAFWRLKNTSILNDAVIAKLKDYSIKMTLFAGDK